jgi:hypothetical protein
MALASKRGNLTRVKVHPSNSWLAASSAEQEFAVDLLDYHSKRAMQEFHAGMTAANRQASEAHLRLSSMHMAHADALAQTQQAQRENGRDLSR